MPDTFDTAKRAFRDLRVSVTDRCNFRCTYCMPKETFGPDYQYLERTELLTFEEIARLVRLSKDLGVTKVRLTGGEPLLRKGIEGLVAQLRAIGDLDLTLTTNGSLLARKADALASAGLDRVTVSLDAVDDATFKAMNDVDYPVAKVLEGIEAAADAGLGPIKINAVIKRGVNGHAPLAMARHFKGSGHIVRFIEYMDVGSTNGWRLDDVISGQDIVAAINAELPLEPIKPNYIGEVASRWRYRDGSGEIGVITSVTAPFCGSCTRGRVSAQGMLYTCLFASSGHDLRQMMRGLASDAELSAAIASIWETRDDRYSDLRSEATSDLPKIEMSYIGG
ncbi:MAG: GTP 3',8-cyclase MoaA [Acidimicrobiia bacterium]|nr:GTP 3',8-cyclase MoaA [Acidimicrobiia bacterium]